MADITKREYSAIDAQPVVLYVKKDGSKSIAYPLRSDGATAAMITIDYQHHEIHGGSAFFIEGYSDMSINNVYEMQFVTPNTLKWNHLTFGILCESETIWQVYEGVSISTSGSTIALFNHDRNSAKTSGNIVYASLRASLAAANAATNITGSTLLMSGIVGSGKNGGTEDRTNEVILKQNTTYAMRATAVAAGFISFGLNWYEHTNST